MTSRRKKASDSFLDSLVERVNAHPLTPEQMLALGREISALPPGDRGFEGHAFAVIRCFDGQKGLQDLGVSAMFRIEAMMRIIAKGKLPGWTKSHEKDESFLSHPALVVAAGQAPVVARGGHVNFDRKALLQLAFKHAKEFHLS